MKKIDQPAIEPNSSGPCVACGKHSADAILQFLQEGDWQ